MIDLIDLKKCVNISHMPQVALFDHHYYIQMTLSHAMLALNLIFCYSH